jgi:hypothetical protein
VTLCVTTLSQDMTSAIKGMLEKPGAQMRGSSRARMVNREGVTGVPLVCVLCWVRMIVCDRARVIVCAQSQDLSALADAADDAPSAWKGRLTGNALSRSAKLPTSRDDDVRDDGDDNVLRSAVAVDDADVPARARASEIDDDENAWLDEMRAPRPATGVCV